MPTSYLNTRFVTWTLSY